jgi:hypothetical protein
MRSASKACRIPNAYAVRPSPTPNTAPVPRAAPAPRTVAMSPTRGHEARRQQPQYPRHRARAKPSLLDDLNRSTVPPHRHTGWSSAIRTGITSNPGTRPAHRPYAATRAFSGVERDGHDHRQQTPASRSRRRAWVRRPESPLGSPFRSPPHSGSHGNKAAISWPACHDRYRPRPHARILCSIDVCLFGRST